MNHQRIALGLAALFLGIVVPVFHHVALHFPLGSQPTPNVISRIESVFYTLPWIEWGYLALMSMAGVVLLFSGIAGSPSNREQESPDL